MTACQLELFDPATVEATPGRVRLRLVPALPRLGDRRAATRLDPDRRHGLEDGSADVIRWGWGRLVDDVPVRLAGLL